MRKDGRRYKIDLLGRQLDGWRVNRCGPAAGPTLEQRRQPAKGRKKPKIFSATRQSSGRVFFIDIILPLRWYCRAGLERVFVTFRPRIGATVHTEAARAQRLCNRCVSAGKRPSTCSGVHRWLRGLVGVDLTGDPLSSA
ncbi:hypothetical protein KCP73_19220 [Salmonella enterica subsp. enterica]|nr:hypothetical protein KCP73_19220 [Salmonella enterica subsp. enterica]